MKTLRDKEWTIEKGVVIKKGQIYMPERKLRGGDDTATSQYTSRGR